MSATVFQVSVFTVKSSLWIYFHIFLVWTSCYITSVTGDGEQVIGSSQAVLAKVGDDVVLPCHIEPSVSAARLTVEWSRPDLKLDFVYLLQDGREQPDVPNHFYKRRTSLFPEELPHGNISLKLSRVQLSDKGTFKCNVPTLSSSSLIQLTVEDVTKTDKYDCKTEGGLAGGAGAGIAIIVTVVLVAAILGCLYWKGCLDFSWKKQNKPGQEEENLALNVSEDLQKEVSNQNKVMSDLQSTLTEIKDGVAAMNSALQKEVSDVKRNNSDVQSTNTALQRDESALTKENSDLQKEVSALKEVISDLQEVVSDLSEDWQEEMSDLDEENSDGPVHRFPEYYKLASNPTGLCVLMCNENFESSLVESLPGTRADAASLTRTFSKLGFRVLKCIDNTKSQMEEILTHLSLENLSGLQEFNVQEWKNRKFLPLNADDPPRHGDAFVCCIMSYEALDSVHGTDGEPLHIDDITTPFKVENCPILKDKPKVFFCEGLGGEGDLIPMERDFFFAMASTEHYALYRSDTRGFFFTQSVCKQLNKGCPRCDIMTILSEVIKDVAKRCKREEAGNPKQIPVVRIDTLARNLVFSPISN